jgi:hypothetical protein
VSSVPRPQQRRRRSALRRLFFFPTALWLAASAAGLAGAQLQARLASRQLRVVRDAGGGLHIVESLRLELTGPRDESRVLEAPLPLVRLPEGATDLRGLGGDVAAEQIIYDPPRVALIGPAPGPELQIVFTYRLSPEPATVELAAELPVDVLDVLVASGNVEARPGRRLALEGIVGPDDRPYARYIARDLAVGDVATLEVVRRRVETRQRFAVLLAVALAAGTAGVYALRRPRRGADPA